VSSSVNSLARDVAFAIELWGQTLKEPRFDARRVEVWRGQELEDLRRRKDDPARLAIGTFNHLMYGDHPIGWEMSEEDLRPDAVSLERLTWVQRRVLCPGNAILGVTGDISWEEVEPLLLRLIEGWTPCDAPLAAAPLPEIRKEGGVFLLPLALEQSTIALAHLTTVRQADDPEYFASVIGNSILGGSGFSSRLVARVRTERGYAYSVSSLWNTPLRGDGLIGAIGQTKSASTVAALQLILDTFREMTETAPTEREVRTAIDQAVNGFVFNFDSADQIVFRQMLYLAEGLPADWLERYVAGLQKVKPADVHAVFRRYAHPEQMTILVVGNPATFDAPLSTIGPVTEIAPP
jgi:zinc protease